MIEFDRVTISLGDFLLDNVSLTIRNGDFYFIMGPSGAGKTIILEAIAGLHEPDHGRILYDGCDVQGIAPEKRRIGLVYQDYSLFPHMTVEKNIAFGMKMRRLQKTEIREQVDDLMKRFEITHLSARAPLTLSGGEQQRVAIARALAIHPEYLLLDEPLSALDPVTREHFIGELRSLHRDQGLTIVQVTHDRRDAAMLGTRMAMIIGGRLIQEDRVEKIFSSPGMDQVARFIGYENIYPGEVISCENGLCNVGIEKISIYTVADARKGDKVSICVRADEITLFSPDGIKSSAQNTFEGVVAGSVTSGALVTVQIDIGILVSAIITAKSAEDLSLEPGKHVGLSFKATAVHLMQASGPTLCQGGQRYDENLTGSG
jgi:molybdate/tungstate transport system ATP-binding protein